jgi:DNA-binding LytR/AlgR family response regulator
MHIHTIDKTIRPELRETKTGVAQRIVVRENGRFFIIPSAQIDWIKADRRNCVLHCGLQTHRVAGPFGDIVERLGEHFVQVSRFSLINIDCILHLAEPSKGALCALMRNGEQVRISRRFRGAVMNRLAN